VKELILKRFNVADPEEIPETENDELSQFGRQIKELLTREGFTPKREE